MLAIGRHQVEEALRGDVTVEKVLIAKNAHLPRGLIALIREKDVKVQFVPKEKLDALARGLRHQGIIAYISPVQEVDADYILDRTFKTKGFALLLDGIQDPQNVGNIIRSAVAFGAQGVILTKSRSAPITETVVRASAGAAFHIPIARRDGLIPFLTEFKERGGWVASLETGGVDIEKVDFGFPLILIVGSEGEGVRKSLLKLSDYVVTIPMVKKISSLNVSSSVAIALYLLYRMIRERMEEE